MKRKSIVFIMTDQQRFDCLEGDAFAGTDYPHLQKLKSESVVFSDFYTAAIPCVPSRQAFLTGRHEWMAGVSGNIKFHNQQYDTWMSVLCEQGYKCLSVGKTHGVHHGSYHIQIPTLNSFNKESVDPGFNHFQQEASNEEEKLFFDILTTDTACEVLGKLDKDGGPFALFIGLHAPHEPYVMPKSYLDFSFKDDMPSPQVDEQDISRKSKSLQDRKQFLEEKFGPLDDDKVKTGISGYRNLMKMIDDCMGKIMHSLESMDMREDIITVFTSDHGEMLGEQGIFNKAATFYDSEVHIPCMIRFPESFGSFGKSRTVNGLASSIDMMPTILDLLDIDYDISLPGMSLRKAIAQGQTGRKSVLSSNCHGFMLRTDQYKFWLDSRYGDGELYNLDNDPSEKHNLFHDADYREIRAELTEKLLLDRIKTDLATNAPNSSECNQYLEASIAGKLEVPYLDWVKKRGSGNFS